MLIFLDIESTGLELSDVMCSIGIIAVENEKITPMYTLLNEGKKIPPKASSIHHITNEMIKNKAKFKESQIYEFLQEHNNLETTIVSHNAPFDLQKLSLSGLEWKGCVSDTLRATKHLIPECELFSLQVLRYELRFYKQEIEAAKECGIKDALLAHNALSDALFVKQLYELLREMVTEDEILRLSQEKVLLQKINFGKYAGKYFEDIAINDRGYLEWMLRTSDLDEDLRYSVEYHLQG
jgi:DNA polymerase III epsilon subunit-like protein